MTGHKLQLKKFSWHPSTILNVPIDRPAKYSREFSTRNITAWIQNTIYNYSGFLETHSSTGCVTPFGLENLDATKPHSKILPYSWEEHGHRGHFELGLKLSTVRWSSGESKLHSCRNNPMKAKCPSFILSYNISNILIILPKLNVKVIILHQQCVPKHVSSYLPI